MTILKNRLTQSLAALCLGVGLAQVAIAKPYSGAEIFTLEDDLYGKYVVRMRAAKGSGVISNFFLWKDESEMDGVFWEEVDVEVFGKDNAMSWQSNIISGRGERETSEEVHHHGTSFGDAYHTFTLEWSPDTVRWLVDGQLIRTSHRGQASDLTSPAQLRLNFWPPNITEWVGAWDHNILPLYMYVNWVEYHRWNGMSFERVWRDDFNTFDTHRWGKADWTFAENRADFSPDNVVVRDGYLVLGMTHKGQEGFHGSVPRDTGETPTPPISSSSSSSSSSVPSTPSPSSRPASSASVSSASNPGSGGGSNGGGSSGGSLNLIALFSILSLLLFRRPRN